MTTTATEGPQGIHIHNDVDANGHLWRVIATFLLITGTIGIAWGFAQAGLLEGAAVMLTASLSMEVQLLMKNGFIVIPDPKSDDQRIERGKNALRDIAEMAAAIIERSSILRVTVLSIGYGAIFVILRAGLQLALGAWLSNIWLALGTGAIVASVFVFPTLFTSFFRKLRSNRATAVRNADNDTAEEEEA